MFKIADMFPIRKGDLVKLREETNERHRKTNGHWEWSSYGQDEHYVDADDHPLYDKMILVLNEPYKKDMLGKVVDVFVQEDQKYEIVCVDDLKRMIV